MKSIILAGQTTRVYCHTCQTFVQATYAYGPFPFDNGVVAENVMRAVCDSCGSIVAVAHQSAPLLKEALEINSVRSTMRLPQELLDYVGLQLDRVGARPNHYDLFLKALLLACHGKEVKIGHQLAKVQDPILLQPHTATLNLVLTPNLHRVVRALESSSNISNTSELLRRLIVLTEQPSLAKPVAAEATRLVLAYA